MQLSRSFFFALLLACLQFCGCSSVKQDGSPSLIEAQDWLIDTSGKATLEDVMSSTNWTSMSGWESWGFGSESIWVRIKLRAATEDNQTSWSMRIRPAVLDYVTLYDPATNSVLRTGDALPLDPDDEMASIVFTLPVSSLPKERTIYLNVTTTSARTLNIEVLPAGYAQHLNRLQEWGMGFATVVSAVFAFWALGQWLTSREKVIGAFAVKQIISTLWSFFILGFARILIGEQPPEGVLSTISSMILFWLIATTLWFYVALLQLYRASPLLLRMCKTLAAIVLIMQIGVFSGYASSTLFTGNVAALLGFALVFITSLTAVSQPHKQPISLVFFILYFVAYGVLNSWTILINLGWVKTSSMAIFGNITQAIFDGLIMFVMLQIRTRELQKEHHQLAISLQHSKETAEAEKQHREEQSQLFAMLAKTPGQVIGGPGGDIANRVHPQRRQPLLSLRPDAPEPAHRQRRQERRLLAGRHDDEAGQHEGIPGEGRSGDAQHEHPDRHEQAEQHHGGSQVGLPGHDEHGQQPGHQPAQHRPRSARRGSGRGNGTDRDSAAPGTPAPAGPTGGAA